MQFTPSTLLSLLLIASAGVVDASPKPKVPKGFVTTNGPKFQLDGKDFYFAGTNAYYLPFLNVYLPPSLSFPFLQLLS